MGLNSYKTSKVFSINKISGVDSQFGFKADHSTSLCTFIFNRLLTITLAKVVMCLCVSLISERLLTE